MHNKLQISLLFQFTKTQTEWPIKVYGNYVYLKPENLDLQVSDYGLSNYNIFSFAELPIIPEVDHQLRYFKQNNMYMMTFFVSLKYFKVTYS